MGTISERKSADGRPRFTAQIRIKRGGRVVHTEAETFGTRDKARDWLKKREKALGKPGGLEAAMKAPKGDGVTLAEAIDRYTATSLKTIGKTKAQVLASIKNYDIADMECSSIGSEHIVAFAEELLAEVLPNGEKRKPQTVTNYLSHLSAVFAIAKPAWKYPLDYQAMKDARTVLKRLGVVRKSGQRDRRPTLGELDRLLEFFQQRNRRRPGCIPMDRLIAFAIFSTRRQAEILRITWADYEEHRRRILVRDMKHPGSKEGNDIRCELVEEAMALIDAMPRTCDRIFPYSCDAVSASFTRACQVLEIDDLTFHDLRHEGISRLFEMGRTQAQAAAVSGHQSWSMLTRYTHLDGVGDKYADWKWLPILTAPMEAARQDQAALAAA